jgi:hypothetical protein
MKLTGENRSTLGKTCPSATLPTINPTWTDPGSNSGLRGERPATNRLSDGTAHGNLSEDSSRTARIVHYVMINSTQLLSCFVQYRLSECV